MDPDGPQPAVQSCGNDVTLNMLAGEVGHRGKVKHLEEFGYGLEDRRVPKIAFLQITS